MKHNAVFLREVGAVALMRAGYRDYQQLAELLGVTINEIERIDLSRAPHIRAWAVAGTPRGFFAELTRPIRCHACGTTINKAPCLVCDINHREQRRALLRKLG